MLNRTTERAVETLASRTSRRSFLGKVGNAVVALVGGSLVASVLRMGSRDPGGSVTEIARIGAGASPRAVNAVALAAVGAAALAAAL